MKYISLSLICLCFVILLCGSMQAQTKRVTKNSNKHRRVNRRMVRTFDYAYLPIMTSVNLSKTELAIYSDDYLYKDKSRLVEVIPEATDRNGDTLLFWYTVSDGTITGSGSKAVWDLSGLKPGNYWVAVFVDDGCGFCSKPMSKEIKVIERNDCKTSPEKSER